MFDLKTASTLELSAEIRYSEKAIDTLRRVLDGDHAGTDESGQRRYLQPASESRAITTVGFHRARIAAIKAQQPLTKDREARAAEQLKNLRAAKERQYRRGLYHQKQQQQADNEIQKLASVARSHTG